MSLASADLDNGTPPPAYNSDDVEDDEDNDQPLFSGTPGRGALTTTSSSALDTAEQVRQHARRMADAAEAQVRQQYAVRGGTVAPATAAPATTARIPKAHTLEPALSEAEKRAMAFMQSQRQGAAAGTSSTTTDSASPKVKPPTPVRTDSLKSKPAAAVRAAAARQEQKERERKEFEEAAVAAAKVEAEAEAEAARARKVADAAAHAVARAETKARIRAEEEAKAALEEVIRSKATAQAEIEENARIAVKVKVEAEAKALVERQRRDVEAAAAARAAAEAQAAQQKRDAAAAVEARAAAEAYAEQQRRDRAAAAEVLAAAEAFAAQQRQEVAAAAAAIDVQITAGARRKLNETIPAKSDGQDPVERQNQSQSSEGDDLEAAARTVLKAELDAQSETIRCLEERLLKLSPPKESLTAVSWDPRASTESPMEKQTNKGTARDHAGSRRGSRELPSRPPALALRHSSRASEMTSAPSPSRTLPTPPPRQGSHDSTAFNFSNLPAPQVVQTDVSARTLPDSRPPTSPQPVYYVTQSHNVQGHLALSEGDKVEIAGGGGAPGIVIVRADGKTGMFPRDLLETEDDIYNSFVAESIGDGDMAPPPPDLILEPPPAATRAPKVIGPPSTGKRTNKPQSILRKLMPGTLNRDSGMYGFGDGLHANDTDLDASNSEPAVSVVFDSMAARPRDRAYSGKYGFSGSDRATSFSTSTDHEDGSGVATSLFSPSSNPKKIPSSHFIRRLTVYLKGIIPVPNPVVVPWFIQRGTMHTSSATASNIRRKPSGKYGFGTSTQKGSTALKEPAEGAPWSTAPTLPKPRPVLTRPTSGGFRSSLSVSPEQNIEPTVGGSPAMGSGQRFTSHSLSRQSSPSTSPTRGRGASRGRGRGGARQARPRSRELPVPPPKPSTPKPVLVLADDIETDSDAASKDFVSDDETLGAEHVHASPQSPSPHICT